MRMRTVFVLALVANFIFSDELCENTDGDLFYLSATQAGRVVKTPPSTSGQYVTPVGEAANTNELIVRIKRPIGLG